MSDQATDDLERGEVPLLQRLLDNLWLLLAIGVLVPGLLYLGWGLWDLAELPTWAGR